MSGFFPASRFRSQVRTIADINTRNLHGTEIDVHGATGGVEAEERKKLAEERKRSAEKDKLIEQLKRQLGHGS